MTESQRFIEYNLGSSLHPRASIFSDRTELCSEGFCEKCNILYNMTEIIDNGMTIIYLPVGSLKYFCCSQCHGKLIPIMLPRCQPDKIQSTLK